MASDRQYHIRAITRDRTSPAALKLASDNVELVVVNAIDDAAAIFKAFEGATYVYAMTPTGSGFTPLGEKVYHAMTSKGGTDALAQEVVLGKTYVDAAKAAGVKLFIWSGLDSYKRNSGGKYAQVESVRALLSFAKSPQIVPHSSRPSFASQSMPRRRCRLSWSSLATLRVRYDR
jgi:hypothetical protein